MSGAARSFGRATAAALAAVFATGLGAPAQPADEPAAVERAAEAALQAIPASDDPDWSTRWDATGSRMSGGPVTWHLAQPDASVGASFRRTGWVGARGEQFSVAVCGDADDVGAVAFRLLGDRGEALAAAFAARGVETAVLELHRAPEIGDPWDDEAYESWTAERGFARYALTGADRRPSTLETRLSCTSPRSRAAQSCRTDARVVYAPDVAGAADCATPGRY